MAIKQTKCQWLRDRREAVGLTMVQSAGLIGVSRQTWNNWEHGLCWPNAKKIILIAELMRVSPRECAAAIASARAAQMYWKDRIYAEKGAEAIERQVHP